MCFSFSFFFVSRFFRCVLRACCVASLCHENREICSSSTSTTSSRFEKKAKKKLSSSPKRMSECPNNNKARGHPPLLVFFSHKEKTPKRQKKSLLVHFIINNETLVWSEKDGGSAFAGGNDGQGDKLRAVFSLYSLSLRGGGVSRVSFVLLESQSHF